MSEGADPALIGRRVAGKFVVEAHLGGGAMGAVYRARDESLERKVALKVMHPAVAIDPSFVSRFHREARAASRLDHPSSMRVIEFGEEADGLLYIAMEYLEGRDLYRVIHEDWPLPEERIADVVLKALGAIAVAHDMGVIHRDLKPENIMILDRKDDEGQDIVKVCDFGIAKITEKDDSAPDAAPKTAGAKLTTAGVVVGTPEYMSPEQARGEKLDSRSDLYSMGIILYQLLTGRTPFLADTALAVVLKHITEAPEPPSVIYPGVHKGLEAVALRALAKAKEERFQSARDMRAALKAAIEGRPMPLETNPPTSVDAAPDTGAGQGSGAAVPAPSIAPNAGAPEAALGGAGKHTPLVAELVAAESRSSRAPIVVAVALLALGLGGVGVVLAQKTERADVDPSATLATESSEPLAVEVKPSAPGEPSSAPPAPSPSPTEAKSSKRPSAPPPPSAKATADATTTAVPTSPPLNATPEPAPSPAPEPPPESTVAPALAPVPPPAPAFNAASCRATLGAPKSASGYSAKALTLRGTDAAWTSCAKTAIEQKPAGRIVGTVRIRFNDNKVFRGATCSGCTPALSECIAASTGKTASVGLKGGDPTGDPEFDVPVTFACD
ncbi:MAG: serine/threonine protein kinase [Labilithrix sp.]|nr:serine/threonine protein kinase [Labilithrix sp.]